MVTIHTSNNNSNKIKQTVQLIYYIYSSFELGHK